MESLEILNGELSPKYDKYNNVYTVSISSDVDKLDLNYQKNKNETINVYGNIDLEEGENKVLIAISDNDNTEYITLIVNKERTSSVTNNFSNISEVVISKDNDIPSYAPVLIGLSCLMIIILIFLIIFRTNKIKVK